jgi:hypothetical protein
MPLTPHRWQCLGPFTIVTGETPLRGLYSCHIGSHCIDDPKTREGSRQAGRPSVPQSLTTLLTRLHLATTLRMRALQVEFPCNCVCSDFHYRGVFIGSWGSSTDLAEVVTHQVVAGWPSHMAGQPGGMASTAFLHHLGLPLLV